MSMMDRRRALMAAKGERIPTDYQPVEWVGINKGVKDSAIWSNVVVAYVKKVSMRYEIIEPATKSTIVICGRRDNSPSYAYATADNKDGSYYSATPAATTGQTFGPETVEFTKINYNYGSGDCGFVGYENAMYVGTCRLFNAKIYNSNNEKIFDGIPCYRKTDGVIGLYDLVSKLFVPGQGTLNKGNDKWEVQP